MKVLLLTRYGRTGASSRIRTLQYLPGLEESGLTVDVFPLLRDNYLRQVYGGASRSITSIAGQYWQRLRILLRSKTFDILWVEKELFPYLPAWVERILERLRIPIVVDYDDAIFHQYDQSGNYLTRLFLGRKIDAVMRSASVVVAGNTYLAERAYAAGARRVAVIPSVVDVSRYRPAPISHSRPFTVGWIGSPTTAEYLKVVSDALRTLQEEGECKIILVGAGRHHLDDLDAFTTPWSEDSEADLVASFDVGIMPLKDSLWEKGKCGYKLIQYMATGIPTIASDVGVNSEIVRHTVTGFIASSTSEWVNALRRLRDNPELRFQMGMAGRERAELEYSLEVTTPRLLKAFQWALEQ